MEDILYAFWICNIYGIGCKKIAQILNYFGDLQSAFMASKEHFEQIKVLREADIDKITKNRELSRIREKYNDLQEKNIHFTYQDREDYPKRLKNMIDAPYGLFYKGNLPKETIPCVAVVGARNASYGGEQIAKSFGKKMAENGIQIISGMARGIDIAAQKGALMAQCGKTYSVLGTGVDICYPRQNIEAYMQIQQNGGLISEFPMQTQAFPYHFPMRNRIISGLADGILVIEAKKGSGSLITAEIGLEQGKEIFVIPGGIQDSLYEGSNSLIQNGAALVQNVRDILDGLGLFFDEDVVERKKKCQDMLETTEKIVYAILSLDPIPISQIVEKCGLELYNVMEILVSLQKKNLVQIIGNNYYAIKL